jgi:cytochrome oxidase Cu insertion factor (SCO1/SenC/PrrC family)
MDHRYREVRRAVTNQAEGVEHMRSQLRIAAVIGLSIVAAACGMREAVPGSERTPIAAGETAPAFALGSADGDTVSLSDYAGKPVLLYFSMGPG